MIIRAVMIFAVLFAASWPRQIWATAVDQSEEIAAQANSAAGAASLDEAHSQAGQVYDGSGVGGQAGAVRGGDGKTTPNLVVTPQEDPEGRTEPPPPDGKKDKKNFIAKLGTGTKKVARSATGGIKSGFRALSKSVKAAAKDPKTLLPWAIAGGLGAGVGALAAAAAGGAMLGSAAAGGAVGLGALWLANEGHTAAAVGAATGGIVGLAVGGPVGGLIGAAVGGLCAHLISKFFYGGKSKD
ncbi:MAG: hypothetical protein ABII00_00980 [Elusimicrobiota bacterium]